LIYAYDPLNRLTNVLANGNASAACAYDFGGNLQTTRYGNNVTNLYQYDSLNRLTNAVWKLSLNPLANFSYLLGSTGTRTNLNEYVGGTNRLYTWQYDNLYRLTNENESSSISPSGNLAYQYDSVGNRTNRAPTSSLLGVLTNQVFSFNTNDWLSADKYDNNGNTTNSANNFYQYDVMNHLTNAGGIVMTYDGDGNRVSKTVSGTTTYYLVDDQNPSGYAQVLEEWTNNGTPGLSKIYNYGLSLISQCQPGTSTNYFIFDGHGSTRMLVGIGGNTINVMAYDAYGNLIASNGVLQTGYLYSGQQYDFDLGLYYNRARLLNPNTGRFWTQDSYVVRITADVAGDLIFGETVEGEAVGCEVNGANTEAGSLGLARSSQTTKDMLDAAGRAAQTVKAKYGLAEGEGSFGTYCHTALRNEIRTWGNDMSPEVSYLKGSPGKYGKGSVRLDAVKGDLKNLKRFMI
jgi:RHS repeat-associated protein